MLLPLDAFGVLGPWADSRAARIADQFDTDSFDSLEIATSHQARLPCACLRLASDSGTAQMIFGLLRVRQSFSSMFREGRQAQTKPIVSSRTLWEVSEQ